MCYQTVAILRVDVSCCASTYCLLECRVSSYAHITYFLTTTCQWRSQRGARGPCPPQLRKKQLGWWGRTTNNS